MAAAVEAPDRSPLLGGKRSAGSRPRDPAAFLHSTLPRSHAIAKVAKQEWVELPPPSPRSPRASTPRSHPPHQQQQGAIRVVHIFAPKVIKTNVENFRALVQRLTGHDNHEASLLRNSGCFKKPASGSASASASSSAALPVVEDYPSPRSVLAKQEVLPAAATVTVGDHQYQHQHQHQHQYGGSSCSNNNSSNSFRGLGLPPQPAPPLLRQGSSSASDLTHFSSSSGTTSSSSQGDRTAVTIVASDVDGSYCASNSKCCVSKPFSHLATATSSFHASPIGNYLDQQHAVSPVMPMYTPHTYLTHAHAHAQLTHQDSFASTSASSSHIMSSDNTHDLSPQAPSPTSLFSSSSSSPLLPPPCISIPTQQQQLVDSQAQQMEYLMNQMSYYGGGIGSGNHHPPPSSALSRSLQQAPMASSLQSLLMGTDPASLAINMIADGLQNWSYSMGMPPHPGDLVDTDILVELWGSINQEFNGMGMPAPTGSTMDTFSNVASLCRAAFNQLPSDPS